MYVCKYVYIYVYTYIHKCVYIYIFLPVIYLTYRKHVGNAVNGNRPPQVLKTNDCFGFYITGVFWCTKAVLIKMWIYFHFVKKASLLFRVTVF